MPYLVSPVVPSGWMARRRQPTLDTGRLLLRPWDVGDAGALIAAYADDAIRHWHARSVESPEEARALIDRWNTGWTRETAARWAVAEAGSGLVVGQAALRSIHLEGGEAEISYWVTPQSRQGGVATQAVQALTRWSFDELGLHRLELHHSTRNAASCRVAGKTGFTLEGTMQGKALHADGRHDMHLHARLCGPVRET